jgi:hypothetical protein
MTSLWVKDQGVWHEIKGAPAALPGLGGWADITAVTGNPTKHQYTDADGNDWTAYQWTSSGDVTLTEGLVETLVVGAGGGGTNGTNQAGGARPASGNGGQVIYGVYSMSAGTAAITVGTTAIDQNGGASSLAGLYAAAQGGTLGPGMAGGAGAGGQATDPTPGVGMSQTTLGGPGIVIGITGSNEEYGKGGDCAGYGHTGDEIPANLRKDSAGKYGWGGSQWLHSSANNGLMDMPATGGTVIIRVPRANAKV